MCPKMARLNDASACEREHERARESRIKKKDTRDSGGPQQTLICGGRNERQKCGKCKMGPESRPVSGVYLVLGVIFKKSFCAPDEIGGAFWAGPVGVGRVSGHLSHSKSCTEAEDCTTCPRGTE